MIPFDPHQAVGPGEPLRSLPLRVGLLPVRLPPDPRAAPRPGRPPADRVAGSDPAGRTRAA